LNNRETEQTKDFFNFVIFASFCSLLIGGRWSDFDASVVWLLGAGCRATRGDKILEQRG
jgi:hypothetical protein